MPAQRRPSFAFGALALTLFALSCGSTGSGGIGAMSCSAGRGPASASDAIVLRNFTLIDGGDHEPVPQAAMVVEQGRISWVGRGADLKAPDGAATTDLNGAYMIPGLINLHAHLGNTVDLVQDTKFHTRESAEQDLRTFATYGVTTVVSMGTDRDTIFPLRNEQRAAA